MTTAIRAYPVLTGAICAECGHPISAQNPQAEAVINAYQGNDLMHRYCRQAREARLNGQNGSAEIPARCYDAELEY